LSYADTENDHSVTSFLNVYSVPYDGSLLLLNIGALFGSGELNNRRYGIMLFNLYRVLSFCSSFRNMISSGVCANFATLSIRFLFKRADFGRTEENFRLDVLEGLKFLFI
jgi:hypothetical protein